MFVSKIIHHAKDVGNSIEEKKKEEICRQIYYFNVNAKKYFCCKLIKNVCIFSFSNTSLNHYLWSCLNFPPNKLSLPKQPTKKCPFSKFLR